MTNFDDSTFAFNRARRRFLQATSLAGAAALLPSALRAAAPSAASIDLMPQVLKGLTLKAPSESDLDIIAAIDPTLHTIATDALAQMKYAMISAASGAATPATGLAATCKAYVATKKPASQAVYRAKSLAALSAPVAARTAAFGRYAALTPAVFAASDHAALAARVVKPQALMVKKPLGASLARLVGHPAFGTDLIDPELAADVLQAEKDAAKKAANEKDLAEGARYKQLEFFISRVKCIDNTGGILEGTDEIAMGGDGVGATDHMTKVPQFHVMDGFDKGISKDYPGGRSFAKFNLPTTGKWPHIFHVDIALAELDSGGGFGDTLQKIWDDVKDVVVPILADAASDLIGGALGSIAIPGLGTLLGAIIGAFIGWLVGLFHNEDDVVGDKSSTIGLWSYAKSYYDKHKLTTQTGIPVTLDMRDSGHYQVIGGWRLVAP